jgi:hypothetical protein
VCELLALSFLYNILLTETLLEEASEERLLNKRQRCQQASLSEEVERYAEASGKLQ